MKRSLVAIGVGLVCGASAFATPPMIIGGRLLDGKDAPFSGVLFVGNGKCSGSVVKFAERVDKKPMDEVIDNDPSGFWVATAAHCVTSTIPKSLWCTESGNLVVKTPFGRAVTTWDHVNVKKLDPSNIFFGHQAGRNIYKATKVLVNSSYRGCNEGDIALIRFQNKSEKLSEKKKGGESLDPSKIGLTVPNQDTCTRRSSTPKLKIYGSSTYAKDDADWIKGAEDLRDEITAHFTDPLWQSSQWYAEFRMRLYTSVGISSMHGKLRYGIGSLGEIHKSHSKEVKKLPKAKSLLENMEKRLQDLKSESSVESSPASAGRALALSKLVANQRKKVQDLMLVEARYKVIEKAMTFLVDTLNKYDGKHNFFSLKVAEYVVQDPKKSIELVKEAYEVRPEKGEGQNTLVGLGVPGDSGGSGTVEENGVNYLMAVLHGGRAHTWKKKGGKLRMNSEARTSLTDICYAQMYTEAIDRDSFYEWDSKGNLVRERQDSADESAPSVSEG